MAATPVQFVKGVGPRIASRLSRLGITTVVDLLQHLPNRYVDRRALSHTGSVTAGPQQTVIGAVVTAGAGAAGRSRRRIFEALIDDGSGPVPLVWFHFRKVYLEQLCRPGATLMVSGDVTQFGARRQFVHPEIESWDAGRDPTEAGGILPIYPATDGVTQRMLRKMITAAWDAHGGDVADFLPEDIRHDAQLISLQKALEQLHFPQADADIDALNARETQAHRSLIFEEIFLLELGLAMRRVITGFEPGWNQPWNEARHIEFFEALPFTLTGAQARVLADIAQDLGAARPMRRLIQGDVGSGKTAVALGAAVQAIAHGHQVAVMAPTEILIEQHLQTMRGPCTALGIPLARLTGSTGSKERREILAQLASGELPLVVGTHALIESDVTFQALSLTIIDEQHRFGVKQRLALREKSAQSPDMLILTATPIPRTLAMTVYGDLDISVIDEMPPGRKPVLTKLYRESQRSRLYTGMRKELDRGRQIYVVYPLVDESEKVDLKNATDMAAALTEHFGASYPVGLLHGRMKGADKRAVMAAFNAGETAMLVTTTVVEVGVDVPNASVMVIEHAERFGLAQLHQLRGRVGRGHHQSYCVLMGGPHVSREAYQRLTVMTQTQDGFRLAEEDLKIRGPGELLGTRQSGLPDLKIARLIEDAAIIAEARTAAFALVDHDPRLAAHPHLRQSLLDQWGDRLQLSLVG
jgi:ATP-dependent DNA helicase RecG